MPRPASLAPGISSVSFDSLGGIILSGTRRPLPGEAQAQLRAQLRSIVGVRQGPPAVTLCRPLPAGPLQMRRRCPRPARPTRPRPRRGGSYAPRGVGPPRPGPARQPGCARLCLPPLSAPRGAAAQPPPAKLPSCAYRCVSNSAGWRLNGPLPHTCSLVHGVAAPGTGNPDGSQDTAVPCKALAPNHPQIPRGPRTPANCHQPLSARLAKPDLTEPDLARGGGGGAHHRRPVRRTPASPPPPTQRDLSKRFRGTTSH